MKLMNITLVVVALAASSACRTTQDSSSKAVAMKADPMTSEYAVFTYSQDANNQAEYVNRYLCKDLATVSNLQNCAKESLAWSDFEQRLATSGMSPADVTKVKAQLADTTTYDGDDPGAQIFSDMMVNAWEDGQAASQKIFKKVLIGTPTSGASSSSATPVTP
jgi:hypothetical protein